jgi:RNA polymerase sigma-70 factor (ECF subfamily)
VTEDDLRQALEQTWRSEGRQVVASIARRLHDLDLAEDAVQEAFAAAVQSWPVEGVPDRPGAWLSTTAWRKALDAVRRESRRAERERRHGVLAEPGREPLVTDVDDVLSLVLTCCHPALATETQVALTLRHVIGLAEPRIAALLLSTPAAVAKRLVRARRRITDSGIVFELPRPEELPARLDAAMSVLYLVFTCGYTAPPAAGTPDLAEDAIRLTGLLEELAPQHLELRGLLALMLLQNSRADARTAPDGQAVPFDAQDRRLWRTADVERAKQLLQGTDVTPPGPYRLEAAIALLHATREHDFHLWALVCDLYDALERLTDSPVVRVNAALARGGLHGPATGLQHLAELEADERLRRYPPLHAAQARLRQEAERQPGSAPVATGRSGWFDHCDHEPG